MGMLLVAGLVHLLTPRAGGGTVGVAASSSPAPIASATTLLAVSAAPPATSAVIAATTTAGLPATSTATTAPTSAATTPTTTGRPSITAAPVQVSLSIATFTGGASRPSMAVALGDDSTFVTTASAVGDAVTVDVRFAAGEVLTARVLVVDDLLGVAVLQVDQPLTAARPGLADAVPGQQVTVIGDEPRPATVVEDHGLDLEAEADTAEGAPVVDDDGQLVGLCTRRQDGSMRVVPAAVLDQIITTTRQVLATTPWLGISGRQAPSGGVEVEAVTPASPAASAGITVGDTIVAVEDRSVRSVPELVLELTRYEPGDEVRVQVLRPAPSGDGSPDPVVVELLVTLAVRPSA
jgi:S1-C subfamily serine protease